MVWFNHRHWCSGWGKHFSLPKKTALYMERHTDGLNENWSHCWWNHRGLSIREDPVLMVSKGNSWLKEVVRDSKGANLNCSSKVKLGIITFIFPEVQKWIQLKNQGNVFFIILRYCDGCFFVFFKVIIILEVNQILNKVVKPYFIIYLN